MKRKFFTAVALTLVLTMVAAGTAFAAVPSDVTGEPCETAVNALMEKNIITGDADGLYHPEDQLTRAQACVIVVKAMNPPSTEVAGTATQKPAKSGFSDMARSGWADGYVSYAVKHNITKGTGGNKFSPADGVTAEEMTTMILRAAGFTDSSLTGTWPANYMAKAEEIKLFEGLGEASKLPNPATKALAAQLTYNGLSKIEAANKGEENKGEENKPAEPTGEFVPGTTAATFGTGSFNENMTTYGGKPISEDAVVYTYGLQKDYKSDMKLPAAKSDYTLDTVNKFKNAKTSCFYVVKDGKIIGMILPKDTGFSGSAMGVINSVSSVIDGSGEKVNAVNSITAGKKVSWLTQKSSTSGMPEKSAEYLDGTVYQMVVNDGAVKRMYKAGDADAHKDFKELTDGKAVRVDSYSNSVIKLSDGKLIEAASNAVVYVLSDDKKEYTAGRLSNIKKDVELRAYDITKDNDIASIIVITKK